LDMVSVGKGSQRVSIVIERHFRGAKRNLRSFLIGGIGLVRFAFQPAAIAVALTILGICGDLSDNPIEWGLTRWRL
jgi:hypothetical protein